jgi:hydrogenase nickel incorporation protein HypB
MCTTCGCSSGEAVRVTDPAAVHEHATAHEHSARQLDPGQHAQEHSHEHAAPTPGTTITLEERVLAKNDRLAEGNRAWFDARGLLSLNLMSSPGSGKTTLLERTVRELGSEQGISVVEGDQETLLDAERIRATGCKVIQVNTGSGCHLDAEMLATALRALDPPSPGIVFIENVGNLVCPALFDLGERERVVIASVTEGADKPLKYPTMFHSASLVILNKIDLSPYVDFDQAEFARAISMVSHHAEVLPLSATTGEGIESWYDWLRARSATSSFVCEPAVPISP